MKWSLWVFAALIPALLLPESAWAWGPATHLHYGVLVLSRLSEVAEPFCTLLSSQTLPFLYGCVSADIVLAKKLGRAKNHCHRWDNGIRLIEETDNPRIKAFATGYVSHLAADTISHNCYVPSKTIESFDGGILRHMYWELLFDKRITTSRTLNLFQEIVTGDFSDCDEYLESKVPMRVFDFSTNKKIFDQLLMLQGLHHWQALWAAISRNSRWDLPREQVESFTRRSVEAIISFLNHFRESEFVAADPIGQDRLRAAHELRRHFKRAVRIAGPQEIFRVKSAVERFAHEPFEVLDVDEHKIRM